MVVPLRTRQGVVGAMTFVSAESGRHYSQPDLQFAETVADRAPSRLKTPGPTRRRGAPTT